MIAYRIQVVGKVQGVFFRASTKGKADDLGLKGWVRNEADGSVLIVAEGSREKLEIFKEWCEHGPHFARVEKVHCEEVTTENFQGFRITY